MKFFRALPLALFCGGCTLLTPQQQAVAPVPAAPVAAAPAAKSPKRSVFVRPAYSVLAPTPPVKTESCSVPLEEIFRPPELTNNLILSDFDQQQTQPDGLTLLGGEMVFDAPVVENEKVRYYIDYYTGPARKTFTHMLQRSERYLPFMRKIFEEEGLPPDLTYLAMVESGFNDKAYSWADASGLWQFIESTGNIYGLSNDWWRDERRDFEKATRAAARHLSDLHERFDGDWNLAIAAYNAGGGTISRAVEASQTTDFWELSRGSLLRDETKNYLPKLLAMLTIARDPEGYGFVDLDWLEPLEYDLVSIPEVTDLELVAKLCEVPSDSIKTLNPELKRWCTPPGIKNYELRIPAGKKEIFLERYAQVPSDRRANYKHHRVAKGETLGGIAKKYNISVADIVDLNHIKNAKGLRVGSDLVLPLNQESRRLPLAEMQDDYVRSQRKTYQVRSGDSLWSIAKRFEVSEKELRDWNQLGAGKLIQPGQTLVVSSQGAAVSSAKKAVAAAAPAPKPSGKIVYKVKSGDTLWKISRQYSVTTDNIKRWNNLAENPVLRPGDQLTLLVKDEKRG